MIFFKSGCSKACSVVNNEKSFSVVVTKLDKGEYLQELFVDAFRALLSSIKPRKCLILHCLLILKNNRHKGISKGRHHTMTPCVI